MQAEVLAAKIVSASSVLIIQLYKSVSQHYLHSHVMHLPEGKNVFKMVQ